MRSYVEGLTRPVVNEYIARIKDRGEANLTADLFEPISVRCIGDVLGLKTTPNEDLLEWFHAMAEGLALGAGVPHDDPQSVWDRLDAANADIDRQLGAHYEDCLKAPQQDSLTSHIMYGGMPEGKVRSLEEMMPTMRVIILGRPAGAGPRRGQCLRRRAFRSRAGRGRWRRIRRRTRSTRFDEGLRWIAPIGVTPRVATQDFELNGVTIPEGATVAIVMSSANRDESRFEDPDRFDMFRKKKPHLAFGFRPHFCSGHFLSRAMGEIALEEVFRQLPNLRLDPEKAIRAKGWRFRGVVELPAKWDA